ncbi:glycosyltransferase family 4 protein [Gramella sp. MT6]|uniref:glycosyltransferase family 4 protein n=1 Tax=Gramella sp. MT6 TaxID=2705471 RepID=UPI001C5FA73A|nr:glycosyltransferase family 4 protein [Gramella sp. MT6]QYA26042.1 glycosyltransferase family 4 protein [Gramella sp. MT6]
MKIIQLIQRPQLRGAEIFACQLSSHLEELGNEVIVVTIFRGDSKLPFSGKIIELNLKQGYRFFDFKGWKEFHKIIKEFKPDIIQANAADTLKFASSSKRIFKWSVPIIFRNANKMGDFINSSLKLKLNNFYLQKINSVISVSKECENNFRETFFFPHDEIQTIEIGVEEVLPSGIPTDLEKIFKKGPVFCHIGSFVPEKNHKGLVKIFKRIVNNFPDSQLLLIGKGKLQEESKSLVYDLNIESNIHFLNYRNDVFDILAHSTAYLMPSFIEGLPAVILEAMYCKTPVVANNVGGIGEVLIEGQTGWPISVGDEDKFVNAVADIIKKSPYVDERVEAAKEMVMQRFLNSIIARRFMEAYKKVAD